MEELGISLLKIKIKGVFSRGGGGLRLPTDRGGGLRLPTDHASYTLQKWEFVHWFQPLIAKRDTYQDHGGKNDFSPHMAAKICDFGGITSSID